MEINWASATVMSFILILGDKFAVFGLLLSRVLMVAQPLKASFLLVVINAR